MGALSTATLLVQGNDIIDDGLTLTPSSKLAVTFDATGSGASFVILDYLVVTGDTAVSIASNQDDTVTGATNTLGQLAETNNVLTKVTLSGSTFFQLGAIGGNANGDDGVVTDIAATATSPTTIASSLKLIDASATTGGVDILAGATNHSSGGNFANGGSLNSDITITYTGLTIRGGSGEDFIENDAKKGIVTDGNSAHDIVYLGGAGAKASVGTGASDTVVVGISLLGTDETPGQALGDKVTFGAGATASLQVGSGAEAGSTAGSHNIGQTKVHGAAAGMQLDFSAITPSNTIVDENAAVASAKNLAAAENAAVAALGAPGVAYFSHHGSEFFIATNNTENSVGADDAVVHLIGVSLAATINDGLVTLH
jgi:hypothetical protein